MASLPIPTSIPKDIPGEPKTLEQWKIERKTLSNRIKSLEQQVERLTSKSSSTTNPPVDVLLKDFYTLGLKMLEMEPSKNELTPTTPIITKSWMNISRKLKALASLNNMVRVIDPVNGDRAGVFSKTIDTLVRRVFKLYHPPGELKYLQHNFGPVGEETPPTSNVQVEDGSIPETLNGMMLRNGPNPKFDPEGNYMWMDGDSMIHGIRFKNGKATYVARYTKTARHLQEAKFQKSQLIKYGDLVGPYGWFASFVEEIRRRLQILDSRYGVTTGNTGLVYHGRRIMALEDFGEPHIIYVTEEGDLKTLGINDYDGKLDHWLTPHPRVDKVTGEMFNLGSLRISPYCIYRVMSKEGDISDPVPITVSGPTYMHELCITENYVIFQDLSLVYDPKKMETTEKEWIFNYSDAKVARYGILPRYAKSDKEIQWFEFDEPSFVFHNVNAWEEDNGKIVLYCCNMEAETHPITGEKYIAPAMFQRFEHNNSDFTPTMPELYKMTFHMNTKDKPTKKRVSADDDMKTNHAGHKEERIYGDWPKINMKYFGRKTQFVYIGEVNTDNKITSVVKYDLKEKYGRPVRFKFDEHTPNTFGSEVVFVPKTDGSTVDEDDGYLITFVHHEDNKDDSKGISYVYVIDAKLMERVASIRLPARVPYGFHAIYVTEEELQNQIKPPSKSFNWFIYIFLALLFLLFLLYFIKK